MKCSEIRDRLLTDHIDAGNFGDMRHEIEDHLKNCTECKAFYKILHNEITKSLRSMQEIAPPEKVWDNIQKEVFGEEGAYIDIKENLFDKMRFLKLIRKPVFVVASFVIFAVIGAKGYEAWENNLTKQYIEEQMDYLRSAEDGESVEGFGTRIEEYFF